MFEYKACDLRYFLDVLQPYELNVILSILEYTTKQEWEQTRLKCYIQAQTQSTKKLKPSDIIKFNWDETANKEKNTNTITTEEIERLTAKANKIIQDKQQQSINGKSKNTSNPRD
mgnify:FL=1